jgi:large subunit ribosomal protein L21
MTEPKNERPEVEDSPATNPEDHPTTIDVESDLPAASEPALAQPEDDASKETDQPEVVDLNVTNRVTSTPKQSAEAPVAAKAPVAAAAPVVPSKKEEPRRKLKPKPRAELKALDPYAVIETGGKQYRVSVGDRVTVEKLPAEAGSSISLDRVLLLGGDGNTRVGTPVVDGATVEATVDDHFRGDKIVVFKYKPKKRYRRRQGHRQSLTHLTITAINT